MHLWQSIVLGLVEGVTEFLPVSSTAHLLLTQRLLGIGATEAANAWAVSIQFGAILAVLWIYRLRVASMLRGALGSDPAGRALLVNVLVAFVPAAVIGKLLDGPIERVLFGLWPVCVAWIAGGVLILVLARRGLDRRPGATLDTLTPKTAVLIGLAQCAALWPGTSRSLATLVAGLALGLDMVAAAEFSFLLGLVTLSAAALYKSYKARHALADAYGPTEIALGISVAAASAFASVRWMIGQLSKRGLAVFGWYRIALGVCVVAALAAGLLRPT